MTPQEYIEQELHSLQLFQPRKISSKELPGEIFKLILSKKFRKYSANETLKQSIQDAIAHNIERNEPINIVFPHGAYKLWRFDEAPYPDWAELFAAMYYTQWLKSICEIYQPGVWFEFFVDDLIVPMIDNIPEEHIELYIQELKKVLDFLNQYQPKNMKMTVTPFATLFASKDDFKKKLADAVAVFKATHPTFTPEQKQVVELNAKPTAEQLKDPHWIEKVLIVHDAYIGMKREFGYYFRAGKIPIFNQPLASGKFLAVGTTKTSIAKFWVGVGVLKKADGTYKEYILSPKQLEAAKYSWNPVVIKGLEGKNFQKIRILQAA